MRRLTARNTGLLSTLILVVAVLGIRAALDAGELLGVASAAPVKVEQPAPATHSNGDFRTGEAF
jgi:hypothetical protein